MGHTNSTTNYSLPQFITTDKPAWLTDVNNAFSSIDTAIKNAADDASTASSTASTAASDASSAITAAATADAKGAGAVASIADTFDATATYDVGDKVMYNSLLYICTTAVTTPGPWTGTTNWTRTTIESLIDLTSPSDISLTISDSTKFDIDVYHLRRSVGVNVINMTLISKQVIAAGTEIQIGTLSNITPSIGYYCGIIVNPQNSSQCGNFLVTTANNKLYIYTTHELVANQKFALSLVIV